MVVLHLTGGLVRVGESGIVLKTALRLKVLDDIL